METQEAGKKYSSYRIEALIGSDTYGNLYRAYDEILDRPVALKVLSAGLSEHEDLVQHFRKNMKNLAQLAHPCIPQIYYFGKQDREHFVASEWCGGGSLSNRLRKGGRLPLPQALKVLLQCMQGLAAAWKLGIAHGNLKPNNVMIDDNLEIKIMDFGVALEKKQDQDMSQSISGAISFMAPELVDRAEMDCRADIYSLGVIFHYMLLNSLPQNVSLDRPSGSDTPRDLLPMPVRQVIDRMTKEDPKQRYSNYEELAEDIEKLAASFQEVPVPAVPRAINVAAVATRKGDSPFDLLADLYRDMATGVLKISWFAVQKKFLIQRGEVVFFESTLPAESVRNLAIARKWLTATELPEESADPETVIRRVLQSSDCSPDQFRDAYLKLMKKALLHAFHWPVFQGEFFAGHIENDSFASLRLSDVLLEASRTLIDGDWVKSRIPPDSLINKTPSFEQVLAPFPLSPEESFLAYRFEGDDMSPVTLSVLTGLPDDTIFRVTYLLQKIGALELRPAAAARKARPLKKPAPPPPRPQPAPPPPPPPPAPETPRIEPAPRPQAVPVPPEKQAPKGTFEEALIPVDSQRPVRRVEPRLDAQRGEACFLKAQVEYEAGNFGKAAQLCKEALQYHQAAEYYHLLGASYARHPRFQRDAEEAFHKAISLAPRQPDYHAVLALFYSQRDLWLRARTHCLKALELSAGHKMANSVYEKVLEKKPGKGDCWCVWGGSRPSQD